MEVFLLCCLSLVYVSLGFYPTVATGFSIFPTLLLLWTTKYITSIPVVFMFSVCVKKIMFDHDNGIDDKEYLNYKLVIFKIAAIYVCFFFKIYGILFAIISFTSAYVHDSLESVLFLFFFYFYLDFINPYKNEQDINFTIYSTFSVFIIGMLIYFGRKMIIKKLTIHQQTEQTEDNNDKKSN
jgi:hypothetical protein